VKIPLDRLDARRAGYAQAARREKKKRPIGVEIARLVMKGDVQAAHLLRGTKNTWSIPEARAIVGASKAASKRYGAEISAREMLGLGKWGLRK
jgi:hypothetical protein